MSAALSIDSNGDPHFPDLFLQAERLRVAELHLAIDAQTKLHGIIAIHSTRLGPALGGCRCLPYPCTATAILDAMRLARGMSYKAAIAGVPHGGGKAVLIKPANIEDREAYFESVGRFIDGLGGRYITAEDSGTNVFDMDIVARCTPHVRGTSKEGGDPSPYTALGVRRGIEAAVRFLLARDSLAGVRVAIQGVGHVGYHLARELHERGARLTVADLDERAARRCADEFDAQVVSAQAIYGVPCDVFSPCALGGSINQQTVRRINTRIIAGSANNQLAEPEMGTLLQRKRILYVPDYVINAGGLIHLTIHDQVLRKEKLLAIYDTVLTIFERAKASRASTIAVADQMAEAILYASNPTPVIPRPAVFA